MLGKITEFIVSLKDSNLPLKTFYENSDLLCKDMGNLTRQVTCDTEPRIFQYEVLYNKLYLYNNL